MRTAELIKDQIGKLETQIRGLQKEKAVLEEAESLRFFCGDFVCVEGKFMNHVYLVASLPDTNNHLVTIDGTRLGRYEFPTGSTAKEMESICGDIYTFSEATIADFIKERTR